MEYFVHCERTHVPKQECLLCLRQTQAIQNGKSFGLQMKFAARTKSDVRGFPMIGDGGTDFEEEMATELCLERIVGSGSTWHSKLDLKGFLARWSLKFTSKKSFVVNQDLIDEAVHSTDGPGGDGRIPLWLFRIGNKKYDMVMMRKNDFLMMNEGEVQLLQKDNTKTELKRKRASVPQLFRDE